MENCSLCGLKLDPRQDLSPNLCRGCELAVNIDVLETARDIRKCEHIIGASTRTGIRLHHCLILIQKARWLGRYEKLGIPTITPPPSEWIGRYLRQYDDIVMEQILSEVDTAMGQTELSAAPCALDAHVTVILQMIDDGRKLFLDKTRYESLNSRIMSYLYNNMLTLAV